MERINKMNIYVKDKVVEIKEDTLTKFLKTYVDLSITIDKKSGLGFSVINAGFQDLIDELRIANVIITDKWKSKGPYNNKWHNFFYDNLIRKKQDRFTFSRKGKEVDIRIRNETT